jgi:hypothetical protein
MARHFPGRTIKLCYEASYIGYCLQRDLLSNGVHCDVVSPSSIPSPRGKAVKTDRIDAGYLAQFYANDLLTIVQPPDEVQERDRDLLRSRQKVMQQRRVFDTVQSSREGFMAEGLYLCSGLDALEVFRAHLGHEQPTAFV